MKRMTYSLLLLLMAVTVYAYTISGHTAIHNGPVEAYVELYDAMPQGGVSPILSTISDPNGFYTFNLTSPGMYYVRAGIDAPFWQVLFYDNVPDPVAATVIHVNNVNPSATDIDFLFDSSLQPGDNSVVGTVENSAGDPVSEAAVLLFPLYGQWMMPYGTYTDNQGAYALVDVADGDYLMHVGHPSYMNYYYNGVQAWPMAEPITLENGEVLTIDPILEPRNVQVISGVVIDAVTNQPIPNARVSAYRVNNQCNPAFQIPVTFTDPGGYYELAVPAGRYHVMAEDITTHDVQYFDGASSPLSATWVWVDAPVYDINFTLNEQTGGDYTISGTITVGGEPPLVPLLAVAVSSDEDWEDATVANQDGGYILPSVPGGDYYVFAVSPCATPTYYDNALSFEEAIQITVNGNVQNIDIDMQTPQESGYYECTGIVQNSTGDPVANATVYFLDSFGNVHDFSLTNDAGEYELPALSNLNYTAVATKTFYSSDTAAVPIGGNQSWNFVMAPTSAEPQEMPTPTQSLTVDVYPNPVVYSTQRSSATVQFSLPKPLETPTLQVYNTKGQLVHKQTLSTLDAGVHALPFAAQDADGRLLSSGLYYVSIKAEGYTGATKVMVMK
jgi:hypothetical protein